MNNLRQVRVSLVTIDKPIFTKNNKDRNWISNPAIPTGSMEKHIKNLLQCPIFFVLLTVLF